ncbi:MMPL family transporter [Phytohabitans suffuscus]|uniref:Membrane protein n=1 Tax=Phytohabitans suffuscus TaxID=624315 RepID=A0A6F8YXV1_9ACTN|nr:MMPL family transporter [Phytohabitans suffuscus]BCB90833.1 membrane protein [Phytohabitans suffuscus]
MQFPVGAGSTTAPGTSGTAPPRPPGEGAAPGRWAARVTSRTGAVLVLVLAAALAGLAFATSPEQPAAGPTDGLPAGAQSTEVTALADRFPSGRAGVAVAVYERGGAPLTGADRAAVGAAGARLGAVGAVPSRDGRAILLPVPLPEDVDGAERDRRVDALRADAGRDLPPGLGVAVTGGPAFARDISAAFEGADVRLLLATAAIVALLLIVTYRSPVLWVVPLAVIGVADQLVAKTLPWVARLVGERTDAAVAGIVSVLVFGAGTDYALLLISRYREELRRVPSRRVAMARALTGAAPAVLASAVTVVLALLTLLAAVLTSNRTLGICAAIGVVVALVFGLVVLPAALVCLPRAVFWPFVPRAEASTVEDTARRGLWSRVGRGVSRRPAAVLAAAVVVLGALAAGLSTLDIGLPRTEQFRTEAESVRGQRALARHFPAGTSQPVTVVAGSLDAERLEAVVGVWSAGAPERSADGRLVRVRVELTDAAGTPGADRAVRDLRAAVAPDGGLVGGEPAADLDRREANLRDATLVVPLVLVVVLLVLVVLLRSLLAPLLLLATVIASFAAALGAGAAVLERLLGIPGLDASVPLLSFLFLVALGVDYNIFLVTRAREEVAAGTDTRAAFARALVATGGVITSAGVLLAAVFAVLGVLPVIVLTQIGVIVGIGVLLDTLLVRTLVVPAVAMLLGDRFWWPAHRPAPVRPRPR